MDGDPGKNFRRNRTIAIGSVLVLLLTFSFLFLYHPHTGDAAWYASGGTWLYRRQITIDHTKVSGTSNLANFPVLISVSDPDFKSAANGGKVGKSDGTDILFTSADGATKLAHEIESYSSTTGQVLAWVNVPAVSPTSDTVLYMYYGNASAPDMQGITPTHFVVWDSNYVGVWHMKDGAGSILTDSTVKGNDGTLQNSPIWTTSGEIANALSFNGTNQYVSVPDVALLEIPGSWTVEAWVNPTALPGSGGRAKIMERDDSHGYGNYAIALDNAASCPSGLAWRVMFSDTAGATYQVCDYTTVSTGTWYHIVGVWDSSSNSLSLYVNGVLAGTQNFSGHTPDPQTGGDLEIANEYLNSFYLSGIVDEPRVSTTVRSADWIKTEYSNQSSSTTFAALGARQAQTPQDANGTAVSRVNVRAGVGGGRASPTVPSINVHGKVNFR
jgi:hypothetical protein